MLAVVAQGALVAALAVAVGRAVESAPVQPTATTYTLATETPRPVPTCIDRFWLQEPALPCSHPMRTLNPLRAVTATAWADHVATFVVVHAPERTAAAIWRATDEAPVLAGIDRTPCAVPPTPLPFTYGEAEDAPCFRPYVEQTREAQIASGDTYGVVSHDGPDGTPVVSFTGTVPAAAQAFYTALPATHTAAVATARALATAGLTDRAERNARRRDRRETRRYWADATATAASLDAGR